MIDFTSLREKLTERAQRIVTIAVEESRRRNHYYLGLEHLFISFIEVERELFEETIRNVGLDPNVVKYAVLQTLKPSKHYVGRSIKIPADTIKFFEFALEHSRYAGRDKIDAIDLFIAFFQVQKSIPMKILASYGVVPSEIIHEIHEQDRKKKTLYEVVSKNYELPPVLRQYGRNLNLLARLDKIPPVLKREEEIKAVMEILCHRERANSVMLIGEPGVGKTALVEGLARLIEFHPENVPMRLRDKHIVQLEMNSLVAGTMFRGMFEERMEKIIKELRDSDKYILFVDEAHTIIGAGSAMGVPADAADILKSALSKGEIQMIGATTLQEYRMYIAEDEALARRFRLVHLKEPSREETEEIVRGLKSRYEKTYGVKITDEAINKLMELSGRFKRNEREPGKIISWLDTACVKAELYDKNKTVLPHHVEEVVSQDSGIPIELIRKGVENLFLELKSKVEERMVGQREAIDAVLRNLVANAGPLRTNNFRPIGVFLFLGPTGVGKTELAKSIAWALFKDENRMVRIDMSEYSDSAAGVEKLIGMPRGIVGSEMGGLLTNRVMENPFTVVLLDEFEKANLNVRNLFLQVFDEGWITDGRGKKVYFSDAIIILTSNIGSEVYKGVTNPLGFLKENVDYNQLKNSVLKVAESTFPPEFLNRMDEIVVFSPLTRDEVMEIARREIELIIRLAEREGKTIEVKKNVLSRIVEDGYSFKYGARFIKREIVKKIKSPLTEMWNMGNDFEILLENGKIKVNLKESRIPVSLRV